MLAVLEEMETFFIEVEPQVEAISGEDMDPSHIMKLVTVLNKVRREREEGEGGEGEREREREGGRERERERREGGEREREGEGERRGERGREREKREGRDCCHLSLQVNLQQLVMDGKFGAVHRAVGILDRFRQPLSPVARHQFEATPHRYHTHSTCRILSLSH